MRRKTYLTKRINTADVKAQYDAQAKKIVADRSVLSWILRDTVDELKSFSLPEIENCIEDVKIAMVSVYPEDGNNAESRTPEIVGLSTEDEEPGEEKVTFDVRFLYGFQGLEGLR